MATELVLLGTAGAPLPVAGRGGISSAVVVDGRVFVVDCGRGCPSAFVSAGLDFTRLEAVFLTHMHVDHLGDLPGMILYPWGVRGSLPPLRVYGPSRPASLPEGDAVFHRVTTIDPELPAPGTADLVEHILAAFAYHLNVMPLDARMPDAGSLVRGFDLSVPPGPVPAVVFSDDAVRVTAVAVRHGRAVPALAYRFDTADGSVVFSGDTAASDSLIALAQGADILVHQVADLDYLQRHGTDQAELARMAALHTDVSEVGGVAERARVGELILSHYLPADPEAVTDWAQRAGQSFSGTTTAGHDGLRRSVVHALWRYGVVASWSQGTRSQAVRAAVCGGSISSVSLFGGRLRPGRAQREGAGRPAEDDAIVTALYQQYREPLMTFVMRLTAGNRAQAEDVVQETMLRAWREAGKLDLSEPSLMPWLTTVARRIVIDDHRRRQARPIELADAELANLPAEDHTAAIDRRLLVADALRALSPLHRQVLNETILRDRTVNQAAEVLGVPVGTVKSRVYYALRALQVVLAERGVAP